MLLKIIIPCLFFYTYISANICVDIYKELKEQDEQQKTELYYTQLPKYYKHKLFLNDSNKVANIMLVFKKEINHYQIQNNKKIDLPDSCFHKYKTILEKR